MPTEPPQSGIDEDGETLSQTCFSEGIISGVAGTRH